MELRLLTTENERRIFGERLAQARAMSGQRFKERQRSQLAKIHVAFGELYGLFESEEEPAERMIAGIVMHDLEMFPQTCPRPDLSHLPPRSVLEIGDRWSLSKGGGTLVFCGVVLPLRLREEVRALLVYLAVEPFDSTAFYTSRGFVKAGEPFEYPYLETLDGGPIWSQAMILEGEALQKLGKVMLRLIAAGPLDNSGRFRLKNFLGLRPSLDRPAFSPSEEVPPSTSVARNGAGGTDGEPARGMAGRLRPAVAKL
ncbi:MAG: hypothetical protein WA005_16815 [Candidatus Binataceae bacterium]